MNNLYPIFLKIEGWPCLVVGGGDVARRKIVSLIQSGAKVSAVSPSFDPELIKLSQGCAGLSLTERDYREDDLDNVTLVIAATDDEQTNRNIFKEAQERGVLINVVDQPDLCNFYVPSALSRGDLKIAVSTGGACPALAKSIRQLLEEQFDESYGKVLECLSEFRRKLINEFPNDFQKRSEILGRIVRSDVMGMAKDLSKEQLLEEMKKWI